MRKVQNFENFVNFTSVNFCNLWIVSLTITSRAKIPKPPRKPYRLLRPAVLGMTKHQVLRTAKLASKSYFRGFYFRIHNSFFAFAKTAIAPDAVKFLRISCDDEGGKFFLATYVEILHKC